MLMTAKIFAAADAGVIFLVLDIVLAMGLRVLFIVDEYAAASFATSALELRLNLVPNPDICPSFCGWPIVHALYRSTSQLERRRLYTCSWSCVGTTTFQTIFLEYAVGDASVTTIDKAAPYVCCCLMLTLFCCSAMHP